MISWIGGKSRISQKLIIPNIPLDIQTYTECFGGAFWTFFKMQDIYTDLTRVIYNDFNRYLVNLFTCAKDHTHFYDILREYKSQDRGLFEKFQTHLYNDTKKHQTTNIPDYDIAAMFAYITTQVFSGSKTETSKFIDLKGKYKSKYDTFTEKMINSKFTNRLDKITNIENLDFEDLLKKYDHPGAFHYVDAPYYTKESYYSSNDFGFKDHERLANILKTLTGRFAMSYYYFDDLEKWFPKDKYRWVEQNFAKASGASSGKKQKIATELLIMNY